MFETWNHLDEQLRERMAGLGLWVEDDSLGVEAVVDFILDHRDEATILT